MAKKQAIVKRLPTVEALGCVDFICSDKTGTLTTNDMIVYCDRTSHEILRDAVTPLIDHHSSINEESSTRSLMEIAVLCNNATLDDTNEVVGSSSTERALLKHAFKRGYGDLSREYERLTEVPFSSDRKFMSVQCRRKANASESISLQYVKGAVEEILPRCKQFMASGRLYQFEQQHYYVVEQAASTMASRGLRVITFARGRTLMDLDFVGLIGLHDPPRPGVDVSIKLLQNSGVKLSMITGDGKETAASIATMLGMHFDGKVLLSGAEVDRMNDVELRRVADRVLLENQRKNSCPIQTF